MGAEQKQYRARTAPNVQTAVRATLERGLPTELMTWAVKRSVRIVSRPSAQSAVAAARDTNAALLFMDCELVDNDAARLETLLMQAQLSGVVVCVGAARYRAAFLRHGADAFVSNRAGLGELLSQASRSLDAAQRGRVGDSGIRRPARTSLELGPMVIDLIRRCVFVHHSLLKLRPAEFEVLVYLALNRHRLVSAHEIVRDALDTFGDGSSARNQLFELRRKLREAGLDDVIATERGKGYRLLL